MKYEKKARRGCSARWMEVPESYVRKVFKCNFIDVETYFRSMAEGLSVFTPFYEYRQKKEASRGSGVRAVIQELPGVKGSDRS